MSSKETALGVQKEIAAARANAERHYARFVAGFNKITDRYIQENEMRRAAAIRASPVSEREEG